MEINNKEEFIDIKEEPIHDDDCEDLFSQDFDVYINSPLDQVNSTCESPNPEYKHSNGKLEKQPKILSKIAAIDEEHTNGKIHSKLLKVPLFKKLKLSESDSSVLVSGKRNKESSQWKNHKRKLYEVEDPYPDDAMEKRRQQAQKSKRNRDITKQREKTILKELESVKRERDSVVFRNTILIKENESLQERIKQYCDENHYLKKHLDSYKEIAINLSKAVEKC